MQKVLLLLALVAAAILNVEAHVKLNTPMSRVAYTAAETTARAYKGATSMTYQAPGSAARACGVAAENARGAVGGKKLATNDMAVISSTIAVNHAGVVYYGIRQYASATDNTVVADHELFTSQSTDGLGVLAYENESPGKLLTDSFIIAPQYACDYCSLYARYYNTKTQAGASTMWNSCSDVVVSLPTYGLRHSAALAGPPGSSAITGNLTGMGYFKLATGIASTTTPGANIKSVEYQVDGVAMGASSEYPFAMEFDSIKYANGEHTIKASIVHNVATTIESKSTTVTVEVSVTTSNACPTPSTKTCPNGSSSSRGIVPNCGFAACPMPLCSTGNLGQPYACKAGTQKDTFAAILCGPLCDDDTCCVPPPNSCGAYTCSGNDMYINPTASIIPCNAPGGPACNDTLCCAPPGRCSEEVCQVAAEAKSLAAGEDIEQTLRDTAPERICGAALCASSDCCTVPADCSAYTCNGVPKTVVAGLALACKGENCSEEECCDPQFTCDQYDCPVTQHHIEGAETKNCSAVTCKEPGYCCEDNKMCTNFDCSVYNLPNPPDQDTFNCERSRSSTGIGSVICGVAECCVNTAAQESGLNADGAGLSSGKTMVIAGVLLGVLVVVVGAFLVWKKQADASRGDHTRNMLDGAKVNAVQMRVPPANRQSVAAIYNTGGSGYV